MKQLLKAMTRELTTEEKQEILSFMRSPKSPSVANAIKRFEKKYRTPITETYIIRIIIEDHQNKS